MKFFVNILLNLCVLYLELLPTFGLDPTFMFEQMHRFGLGNRIHDFRRMNHLRNQPEYPAPLPSPKPNRKALIPTPYRSIFQGRRMPNDTRVFRRTFEYEPQDLGHHVYCEGIVNCRITHMAIETKGGVPILLKGGAGYHHFEVIVKAKPHDALTGSVRAYCLQKTDSYYTEKPVG